MKIDSIVQPTANVVRIVNLEKGDVYKRVITSSYSDAKLVIGVVREVLISEDKTTVVGVEYEQSFGSIKVEDKIMVGDTDVMIYPATPDELKDALDGFHDFLEREVDQAQTALEVKQDKLKRFSETALAIAHRNVQEPAIESVTV